MPTKKTSPTQSQDAFDANVHVVHLLMEQVMQAIELERRWLGSIEPKPVPELEW